MIRSNDKTYKFTINDDTSVEVFVGDKTIEVYEEEDPGNSGFVFNSINDFVYFCNCLSDIIEEKQKKDAQ